MRELKKGDLLIEHTVYCVEDVTSTEIIATTVQRQGSKFVKQANPVAIAMSYADAYLQDGINYETTVKVGKEDKKDGTLGIRSIFENIPPYKPFSVLYTKQETVLSKKAFNAKLDTQLSECLDLIEKAKTSKKSISDAAKAALKHIQENPITPTVPGEDRALTGYKLSNETRDGRYECVDFNLLEMRPVNINTLKDLVVDNVRYILE